MTLTIFDIIIFAILIFSTLNGVHKGFFGQIVQIVGFILIVYLTIFLEPHILNAISNKFSNYAIAIVAASVLAFLCSSIVVGFFTSKIIKVLTSFTGGTIDKFIGFITGSIIGLFFSSVIFTLACIIETQSYLDSNNAYEMIEKIDKSKYTDWLKKSNVSYCLELSSETFLKYIPNDMLQNITLPETPKPLNPEEQINRAIIEKSQELDSDIDPEIAQELKEISVDADEE